MIDDLARQVNTAIRANGSPLGCVFGPERTDGATSRERVVIEHSPTGGDAFGPAVATRVNPKSRATRKIACRLRIFAQSSTSGATVADHRRRAEAVLDLVFVALDTAARGTLRTAWSAGSGGFVAPDDLAGSQTWNGALYELPFTVDRAVLDTTFVGAAAPEITLGAGELTITSTTQARLANGDEAAEDADIEPACGG